MMMVRGTAGAASGVKFFGLTFFGLTFNGLTLVSLAFVSFIIVGLFSLSAVALAELPLLPEMAALRSMGRVDWETKPSSALAQAKYFEYQGQGEACLKAMELAENQSGIADLRNWLDLQTMRCHFWIIKKAQRDWNDFKNRNAKAKNSSSSKKSSKAKEKIASRQLKRLEKQKLAAWKSLQRFLEKSKIAEMNNALAKLVWRDLDGFLLSYSDELDPWYLELMASSLGQFSSRDRERVLALVSQKGGLWSKWLESFRPASADRSDANPNAWLDAISKDEKKLLEQWEKQASGEFDLNLAARYLENFPGGTKSKSIEADFRKRLLLNKVDFNRAFLSLPMAMQISLLNAFTKGDSSALLKAWTVALIAEPKDLSEGQLLSLGKQAQTFGFLDLAGKIFSLISQRFSAQSEAADARLRLGLIALRSRQYAEAAEVLGPLKYHEKYGLSAWYWQIRALQMLSAGKESKSGAKKTSSKATAAEVSSQKDASEAPVLAQAQSLALELIKRFPLTYYGLKLRQEYEVPFVNGATDAADPLASAATWILLDEDMAGWKRAKHLLKYGWTSEANSEIQRTPWPRSPEGLYQLATMLCESGVFLQGISAFSRLADDNEELRLVKNLGDFFPMAWQKQVDAESQKQKISSSLVWALMRQESAFSERATSPSPALGLMQLLFSTAKETATGLGISIEDAEDVYLPANNIRLGTRYIAQMIDIFRGNVPVAISAYNAGPGRMQQWFRLREELRPLLEGKGDPSDPLQDLWMDEIPYSEPSFYVKAVLRNAIIYRWLSSSKNYPSDLTGLADWTVFSSRTK